MVGWRKELFSVSKVLIGCIIFALGFNLFLIPNGINAGGISGLSMLIVKLAGFGSIGTITAIINLPLFALAGLKIGKRFFILSLLGMLVSAVLIDSLSMIPKIETEPLIGSLYGGAICGLGLGIVFSTGGSTGGSDIVVRLLKRKWQHIPIGTISICFDMFIAVLTGIVFKDIGRTLYSGISIFLAGQVIDAVVYRFDYSKTAWIISREYQKIADEIGRVLGRGATLFHGEGCYTHSKKEVILTAIKRRQLAELKELVTRIDPDAFIIVQEAHQVLGDGFSRYSKDSL